MSKVNSRILKFPLELGLGDQIVTMSKGSKILCVALQRGVPTLWASCPEVSPVEDHVITLCLTGGTAEPNGTYIGTVLMEKDSFVAHFYELARR